MRLLTYRKFRFSLILFIAVSFLLLIVGPLNLYGIGATYDAAGGSNWDSYVGYGSHITGTFDVTATASSSAVLTIHARDIDEESGEIDNVYFIETNGTEHFLGYLSGQDSVWTTTSFTLNKDWVKVGTSSLRVEPDVGTQFNWLVQVDRAQLVIDSGVSQSAEITNLTLDNYDNSGTNVSLNSTVSVLISTAGSYKIETNLIDSLGNNIGTFFYDIVAGTNNFTDSRTTNFTYLKSLPSGTFTINAFLFDNGGGLQSTKAITFNHVQDSGIDGAAKVVKHKSHAIQVLSIVEPPAPAWVRTGPMVCYQVWVNEDNNFEFVFWWEYKDNNWVKIYDMAGNEVFSIDMPYGDAHFVANLPDGMYTVKTFNDQPEPIQTFIIGKP
jgi:hypothetical protein